MTKDEAKKAIEVLQGYIDGKEIEWALQGRNDWELFDSGEFNFTMFEYRIKPEPKYIPFTFEDAKMLIGKAVKIKESGAFGLITVCTKNHFKIINNLYAYNELLEDFTFLDGSPCGKLSE